MAYNDKDYILGLMAEAVRRVHIPTEFLFIARFCYGCQKPLNFSEFMTSNPSKDIEELINFWGCKDVEIYCCECYRHQARQEEMNKLIEKIPMRSCEWCKRELPIEHFMNIKTMDIYDITEKWLDESYKFYCKPYKVEKRTQELRARFLKFKKEGMSIEEYCKLGLSFGISILKNNKELKNPNDCIKIDDKIEVIVPNDRVIAKLRRLCPDEFDRLSFRHRNRGFW